MSSDWDEWFKRFFDRRRSLILPDFERVMDEMEKEMAEIFRNMEDAIPRDMVRERRFPDGSVKREYGPFVYGYSVKIGPDGKPVIREFGNIKPGIPGEGRPPLDLQDQREPLVDVIDEEGAVKVITELPGVDKKDIKMFATERSLTISVDTPQRKYYKVLDLPSDVDESSAKSSFHNGILETVLTKKKRRERGTQIKIE